MSEAKAATKKKLKKPQYAEARLIDLCNGDFVEGVEACIRKAVRAIEQYEKETGNLDAKVSFAISGSFERDKTSDEFLVLSWETKVKEPKNKVAKMVRHGGGRLLFDPEHGEGSINGADQSPLVKFDRFGHTVPQDAGEDTQS